LDKIKAKLGQKCLDLSKIKILHPQKHSITYGYAGHDVVQTELISANLILEVSISVQPNVIFSKRPKLNIWLSLIIITFNRLIAKYGGVVDSHATSNPAISDEKREKTN